MTQPAPPTKWLLAYRLLGLRLPREYRAWVAEDVRSSTFLAYRLGRTAIWAAGLVGLYVLAQTAMYQAPSTTTLIRLGALALAFSLLGSRETLVRRTLRWQRVDEHGNPVAPVRLAVWSNTEAALAVTSLTVALTSGFAVFGYGLRPNGLTGAQCQAPKPATMALITAGLKDPSTKLVSPQSIKPSKHNEIVVAYYLRAKDKAPVFIAFIINGSTVTELRTPQAAAQSPTTFAAADVHRVSNGALQRVVSCLVKAGPR